MTSTCLQSDGQEQQWLIGCGGSTEGLQGTAAAADRKLDNVPQPKTEQDGSYNDRAKPATVYTEEYLTSLYTCSSSMKLANEWSPQVAVQVIPCTTGVSGDDHHTQAVFNAFGVIWLTT